MKKWIIFTIIICIVLGCLFHELYSYYAPPTEHLPYITQKGYDDTLRIAYIGDSWAFMHREHHCKIQENLEEALNRPVAIHSYGICGLTSKDFYENMFYNEDLIHFINKRKYTYFFITLGINDTYKKMSLTYYQKSMKYIIMFCLANHIKPIILEIPDYDIYKAFERQKNTRKTLRYLSMFINDIPIDCKQQFRDALNEMIEINNYSKKVSIIRYDLWNRNGEKDLETLYRNDGLHLNEKGYAKLDSCIIEACKRHSLSTNLLTHP